MAIGREVEPGVIEIAPNPGPQTQFLASPADIVIYGGSAGGGKTLGLLLAAAAHVHVPGYTAVIFRRTNPEIIGSGGLWEESQELYGDLGGTGKSSPHVEWRWEHPRRDAIIEMRHLQLESDKLAHKGKQYAFVGFDEVTAFSASQFWYLISRLRSTCGVRPMLRATCNPDPDSFIRELIGWWIGPDGLAIPERSGVIRWFARRDDDNLAWADTREELVEMGYRRPSSLTFIRSTLEDNHALEESGAAEDYRTLLDGMQVVERARVRDGNWDIRPAAGNHFRRNWFNLVEQDDPILDEVVAWVRGWDLAASEATAENPDPDWTAGALVGVTRDERYVIRHVERGRWSPGKVRDAVKRCGQHDGRGTHICLWQDPGQAGKDQMDSYRKHLAGFAVKTRVASANKLAYADIWSPLVEKGKVYVVRGPSGDPWHDEFFGEGDMFPDGKHDDQIDAVSRAMVELTERFKHKRAAKAWQKAVV